MSRNSNNMYLFRQEFAFTFLFPQENKRSV